MHIVISTIYGCTLWFSAMAYALITGGPVGVIAMAGPFIISAGVVLITGLEYAFCKLHTRFAKSEPSDARP